MVKLENWLGCLENIILLLYDYFILLMPSYVKAMLIIVYLKTSPQMKTYLSKYARGTSNNILVA